MLLPARHMVWMIHATACTPYGMGDSCYCLHAIWCTLSLLCAPTWRAAVAAVAAVAPRHSACCVRDAE